MADMTVASAVILPEPEELTDPALNPLKRRQSSVASNDSKRPRVDHDESAATANPAVASPGSKIERKKSGAVEERKRGQRLFGALLGTLSQSSASPTQRRRVDIEKKQQAKLKQQAEDYDEQKRKKYDAILATRRKEQEIYDKQSMRLQHSNLLATAHFLKTKAEPALYYKPWDLRPEEEARIKAQIDEAQAAIDSELAERQPQEITESIHEKLPDAPQPDVAQSGRDQLEDEVNNMDMVGNADDVDKDGMTKVKSIHDVSQPVDDISPVEGSGSRGGGHEDDAGEVMDENQEDTVIY